MSDATWAHQRAILDALAEIWQSHPDLRLGQLICAVAAVWDREGSTDPFYMPDDFLFKMLPPKPGPSAGGSHDRS